MVQPLMPLGGLRNILALSKGEARMTLEELAVAAEAAEKAAWIANNAAWTAWQVAFEATKDARALVTLELRKALLRVAVACDGGVILEDELNQ